MDQSIVGWILAVIATGGLLYSSLGRATGFHRTFPWQGGGRTTFSGEISIWLFIGSGGGFLLTENGAWCIPAIGAWIAGYVSQHRAHRRHQLEEEALRARNALDHPGIFDTSPPTDLDAVPGDQVDLYDAGACTFLGVVDKSDIRWIVDGVADMEELGPNDIYFLPESLEMIPRSEISSDFRSLVQGALAERDELVLRWMPPTRAPDDRITKKISI